MNKDAEKALEELNKLRKSNIAAYAATLLLVSFVGLLVVYAILSPVGGAIAGVIVMAIVLDRLFVRWQKKNKKDKKDGKEESATDA